VPRVVLGTHEPASAKELDQMERKWGAKLADPVDVPLPEFRFRPQVGVDARYARRLAEAARREEAARESLAK
jgi:hypothetical protein